MFPNTINSHLYAHGIPLRWIRLPLLLATQGLAAVCIAVCAQAIRGIDQLESFLKSQSVQQDIDIMFDVQDIRAVNDVLLTVAILVSALSIFCISILSRDWVSALVKTRHSNSINGQLPLSTRALKYQAMALSFTTLWLFTVLIPTTVFVRQRSAKVTIRQLDATADGTVAAVVVGVPLSFWDSKGYTVRCLAAAPWFTFIAAFPASLSTWSAYFVSKNLKAGENSKWSDVEKKCEEA
ncbi:hypothetical protein BD410DRAFT_901247 [Rickenella mellea]|uniref:Uncharacterized protein n=1 Tax=Rickenella mellea TaxID=50990 RepID=A0A4Y7PQI7_9AGAM|nr:hypothetical protein BD410DRAFT_901247 [Rickenella mellea]